MTPARLAATYRTIAVDGADGTGKTTLVNRLRAEHGFTVVHSARTPDGIDLIARYRRIRDRVQLPAHPRQIDQAQMPSRMRNCGTPAAKAIRRTTFDHVHKLNGCA